MHRYRLRRRRRVARRRPHRRARREQGRAEWGAQRSAETGQGRVRRRGLGVPHWRDASTASPDVALRDDICVMIFGGSRGAVVVVLGTRIRSPRNHKAPLRAARAAGLVADRARGLLPPRSAPQRRCRRRLRHRSPTRQARLSHAALRAGLRRRRRTKPMNAGSSFAVCLNHRGGQVAGIRPRRADTRAGFGVSSGQQRSRGTDRRARGITGLPGATPRATARGRSPGRACAPPCPRTSRRSPR